MNNVFIDEMADLSPKNIVYFFHADHAFDEIDRKIYRIFSAYLHENQEGNDEDLLYCWYYCMHQTTKSKKEEPVLLHLEKFYRLFQQETCLLTKEQVALFFYRMAVHIRFYFLSSLEKEGIVMALTEDDLFALKRIQGEIKMGYEKTLSEQLTGKLAELLVAENYFSFCKKEKIEFNFTLRSFCYMCFWHYQSKQDMSYVVKKGPFSFLTKHLTKVR